MYNERPIVMSSLATPGSIGPLVLSKSPNSDTKHALLEDPFQSGVVGECPQTASYRQVFAEVDAILHQQILH